MKSTLLFRCAQCVVAFSFLSSVAAYADNACMASFQSARDKIQSKSTQSVIVQSTSTGIVPFVTIQSQQDGRQYSLWQTLNGEVRGYALRDTEGFDYSNNKQMPSPLSWHPTLIWDKLFASKSPLKNYSCVLTGRTRLMGKKVSLLRLIPQEGLRYSFLIAKEDDIDFPVELTVFAPNGDVVNRLTTMDSRIIGGIEFPFEEKYFESMAYTNQNKDKQKSNQPVGGLATSAQSLESHSSSGFGENRSSLLQSTIPFESVQDETGLLDPTKSAGASVDKEGKSTAKNAAMSLEKEFGEIKVWHELTIPKVFQVIHFGAFPEGGQHCYYQEFSDGLVTFRVYRNLRSSVYYPVMTRETLTVLRRNTFRYEYSVVGEVPIALAEYVLSRINEKK